MATGVSIVVPVYRNADTLEALYERIGRAFEGYPAEYEILFVDDASPDRSLEILRRLAERDSRVGVLALTDNCGQNRAVLAGIGEASGRVVTVLDADLQDDPQVILRLLRMIDEGASVAFAGRRGAYESAARLKQSWVFKRLLWLLSRGRLPPDAGLFLAMRSDVWTSLERTRGTFLLSRLARCGFVMRSWPVERRANPVGQTGYSNLRRLRLALGVLWEAAAPAFLIRTPGPPRIAARLGARFRMISNETETVAKRDP